MSLRIVSFWRNGLSLSICSYSVFCMIRQISRLLSTLPVPEQTINNRGWTPSQKALLCDLVNANKDKIDWSYISRKLNKPKNCCISYYNFHFKGGSDRAKFSRREWSNEELKLLNLCKEINQPTTFFDTVNTLADERGIDISNELGNSAFKIIGMLLNRNTTECSLKFKKLQREESNELSRYRGFRWTEAEDARLRAAYESFPMKWDMIAEQVGTRNEKACQHRWENYLNPKIKQDSWSDEDAKKLENLVTFYGKQWSLIQQHFPDRSRVFLEQKYKNSQNLTKNNEIKPDLLSKRYEKKCWSKEDLDKLKNLVLEISANIESLGTGRSFWNEVASHFPGRLPNTCRLAYHHYFNSAKSTLVSKASSAHPLNWSDEELKRLMALVPKYQSSSVFWDAVAKQFPNRSASSCRCRYVRALSSSSKLKKEPKNESSKSKQKRSSWTKEELLILNQAIKEYEGEGRRERGFWSKVAERLPRKTVTNCINQYRYRRGSSLKEIRVENKPKYNEWSGEEIEKLRAKVDELIASTKLRPSKMDFWKKVVESFPNRNSKSCYMKYRKLLRGDKI